MQPTSKNKNTSPDVDKRLGKISIQETLTETEGSY